MTEPKKEKPAKYVITDKDVKNDVKALKEENKRLNESFDGAVRAWRECKAIETTNSFEIDELKGSVRLHKWIIFCLAISHIAFYIANWKVC